MKKRPAAVILVHGKMTNPHEIFQREKELCRLLQSKEERQIISISYNVLSESLVIWVGYNKEDNWDTC